MLHILSRLATKMIGTDIQDRWNGTRTGEPLIDSLQEHGALPTVHRPIPHKLPRFLT